MKVLKRLFEIEPDTICSHSLNQFFFFVAVTFIRNMSIVIAHIVCYGDFLYLQPLLPLSMKKMGSANPVYFKSLKVKFKLLF